MSFTPSQLRQCCSWGSRARACTCSRTCILPQPLLRDRHGQAPASHKPAESRHHPEPNLWLCSFPVSCSALVPQQSPEPGLQLLALGARWEQQSLLFGSTELPQGSQGSAVLSGVMAAVSQGRLWGNTWKMPDLLGLVAAPGPQGSWGRVWEEGVWLGERGHGCGLSPGRR